MQPRDYFSEGFLVQRCTRLRVVLGLQRRLGPGIAGPTIFRLQVGKDVTVSVYFGAKTISDGTRLFTDLLRTANGVCMRCETCKRVIQRCQSPICQAWSVRLCEDIS